jgi:chloramphenicol 3-O-phosphotransferase
MDSALILTGAPGSGKSEVLEALSTLLEIERVPYGAIEQDELSRGWPWLRSGQWLSQLAAVIALQREIGRQNFLVTATTENEDELRGVIDTIGADRVLVVCLAAPAPVVAERVAAREPDSWPGKRGLIEHAGELADRIPSVPGIDVVLSTDGREPDEVAAEIRELLRTHRIVEAT